MNNFDEVIPRAGTGSLKWDAGKARLAPEQAAADPLPMWVADMDFRAPGAVIDALRDAVAQGVYGYGLTPDSYYAAVAGWQRRRFGWEAAPAWIVQAPGVVNALDMAIQAFSSPGDAVIIQTPAYIHLHHDVRANGRRLIEVPLTFEEGRYHFDPERFEAAIEPGTRLFLLCNPHNPTGRVWTREDLLAMADICARHDILVVSDEIHQDLIIDPACRHIPFAMLGDAIAKRTIVCTAPSKTFNLAGLQCANVFIPNPALRAAYRRQAERCGVGGANIMGTLACETAYRHGEAWLDEVLAYIRENRAHFRRRAQALDLPFDVLESESLYLTWIDCRQLNLAPDALHDLLLRKARVWLDPGTKFGPAGAGFMRANLACPRALVDEALDRLQAAQLQPAVQPL